MNWLANWFRGNNDAYSLRFDPATGRYSSSYPRWKLKPLFAWYDFWVGVYIDRKQRRVYFFPIPCVGFVFYWG